MAPFHPQIVHFAVALLAVGVVLRLISRAGRPAFVGPAATTLLLSMVDYMTRTLRAAITNEAPGGRPLVLPQGVLGPTVLLINELAGSGGDYFPWAFRQQKVGPLVGTRTWGGLVASSVHYPMVDGGFLTAPNNAVFDPINNRFVGENEGVPPDIEVVLDAKSVAAGRDPQLERAVQESLRLVEAQGPAKPVTPPPFPRPSKRPGGR